MGDTLYRAIRLLRFPFAYRCLGFENVRDSGPGIYVANHLDSVGPIEMVLSVPLRFHPWVIAEMTDPRRAPRYLYDDFVGPICGRNERLGLTIAAILSRLTVALLRGLDCIPVDRSRHRYMDAFHRSMEVLLAGGNLLIFPEDPQGAVDPQTPLRPFLAGFLLLCPQYARLAGRALPVYPVAVDRRRRTVEIAAPLFFARGDRPWRDEVEQARNQVQAAVGRLLGRSADLAQGTDR